jgi:hypothetical protein
VESPTLSLPGIGDLLQKVLHQDLEQQASDGLRRLLDSLRKHKT